MYRHEAIAVLQKHRIAMKSDVEIKPWMIDAVLEGNRIAHEQYVVGLEKMRKALADATSKDNRTADLPLDVTAKIAEGIPPSNYVSKD